MGDSLLSEGRTASTSNTTPIQIPSVFTKQDYKAEKEALKNCLLSPPDEFSGEDNTKKTLDQSISLEFSLAII